MRRETHLLLIATCVAVCQLAVADTDSAVLAAVSKDVKEVCTQPQTQGEHWSISGKADGEAGIQLKLLKLASIKGDLQFTKEEWSGIQRVLAADQAGDNERYRKCVETLIPQFLSKVGNHK